MKLLSPTWRTAAFFVLAAYGQHLLGAANPPALSVSSVPTMAVASQGSNGSATTTESNPDYYYPGRFGTELFHDSFDASRRSRSIYYPSAPPPLGGALIPTTSQNQTEKLAAPVELREYLFEPFFAPLSALLLADELSPDRRADLDVYRARRLTLLTQLRAKLVAVKNSDLETRQRELAVFAQQQAPALAALEGMAEELRTNLVHGTWLESGVDWNENRGWRLGDKARRNTRADLLMVVNGVSFFQDGLLSAQRLLLRELAMELAEPSHTQVGIALTSEDEPYLSFSPATARIELPAGLPAGLANKIKEYRAAKAELKNELQDLIYQTDRSLRESSRVNAMKALAVKQAPRLAALEQLAEEIRNGLALLPVSGRPKLPIMPLELRNRILTYLEMKTAWQNAMLARLYALKMEFPDALVEFDRTENSLTIKFVPNRNYSVADKSKRDAAQVDLAAFNSEQLSRYTELTREKNTISEAVVKEALAGPEVPASVDQLRQDFTDAIRRQERWERYGDYETAVLQPGLSPEQRRLLFGAGLQNLDLPLVSQ